MPEVTTTPLKGISIRDRFAVEALGFLIQKYESNSIPIPDIVARAYEYASNMLTKANTSGASDTDYNIGKILTEGFAALVEAIGEGGGGTSSSFNGKVQNVDNTNFRVIGTQSYGEGTSQKTGVLNVAVVSGGGGGGSTDVSEIVNTLQYTDQGTSNVITLVNRINRLLDILGYYPGSPDATLNSTQHKDLKDLISTIANVNGPFMRDDAEEASALVLNNISDLVVFADWDNVGTNRPFRVPISNFDSKYGLVLKICSDNQFPATADTKPGYYYKLSGSGSVAVLNTVIINLPSLTIADGKPLKTIMFNFSCIALVIGGTVPFSVNIDGVAATSSTLKFRGSNPGSAIDPGTYEVDCVHNGYYWLMGLTKIVS